MIRRGPGDRRVVAADSRFARRKENPGVETLPKHYRKKTWVTRPRPEIDRVASAWLIRRFIDPQARFFFAKNATAIPRALPFDFSEGEFLHHGDDCTFETLLVRFRIMDKGLRKIGEMVHDSDLEDEKFKRSECIGIDRVLKGWAKQGMSDRTSYSHSARNVSMASTQRYSVYEQRSRRDRTTIIRGGLPLLAETRLHLLRRADRPDCDYADRAGRRRSAGSVRHDFSTRLITACSCPVPKHNNSPPISDGSFTKPGVASSRARSSSFPRSSFFGALSFVYAAYGNLPWIAAIFYGLKPAVMAIVAVAVIRIGRKALKNEVMWTLAALAFVAIFFFKVPFPLIILSGGLIGFLGGNFWKSKFNVVSGHVKAATLL